MDAQIWTFGKYLLSKYASWQIKQEIIQNGWKFKWSVGMAHAYTDEKVATVQTDFRGFEVMSQVLKVMSLVTLSPEILILYLKLFLSCQSSAT